MSRVSAKFVPRLLTDDQKENRVEIKLFANANGNENFLKNITGDETWIYRYDVETKMQSSQWMGKGLLVQKSTHESVKDQGDVRCFLIGKELSIMNLYHVVRW